MRKKTKRKNHKFFKTTLICFIIISLIGLRYFYLKSANFKPNLKATSGTICTTYVDIYSQNNSTIKKIYVKANDFVKKGDKLAELDTKIIDAKINRIKAKIAYEKEKTNYFKLNEDKALEEYLNAKKDSSLDINQVQEKLSSLEKMQFLYKIEKAKVDLLDAENRYLNEKRQKSILFSPKDGQIVDLDVFQDKFVFAKEKLFTISDSENIWVNIKVNKDHLSMYELGENFNIEIKELTDAKFQGNLFNIDPIDPNSEIINLKVSINQLKESPSQKTYHLKAGMTASFSHD